MITLGHLSDLHATDPSRASARALLSKRFFGWLSWRLNRRHHYRREVAEALFEDLKRESPDHVAVTGDLINIGLLYQFSEHDERENDAIIRAHAGYLEFLFGTAFFEAPIELSGHVGLGFGGAGFDFSHGFDDPGGAAVQLRGLLGVRVLELVELEAGAGYFYWGYPGEKVGHGGWGSLGLAVRF